MVATLTDKDRQNREQRHAVALKRVPADSVLRDVKVLDVHSGLVFAGGIAMVGERIEDAPPAARSSPHAQ